MALFQTFLHSKVARTFYDCFMTSTAGIASSAMIKVEPRFILLQEVGTKKPLITLSAQA